MELAASTSPYVVLASTSPRRRELLASLHIPFEVIPSEADEITPEQWAPEQIVMELALRKAKAVQASIERSSRRSVIIGSDTIVVLDGQVLGKPKDTAEAAAMLRSLQGRSHHVYTAVACIDANTGRSEVEYRSTIVKMRALTEEEIIAYAETGEGLDKAGGYDTTMHLGDIGQYRIISESPDGRPEIIVGHTVSKVTFRPMSDEEIWAYVKTGDPLDKAGAYGVQGIGSVFIEKIEGDFYSIMGLPLNLLYQMLLMFGISLFNQS